MAPVFHSIMCLFWKWLFYWAHIDLNHMLHTVFLFLVRWNWRVCMCVSVVSICERNTDKDKRETEMERVFPSVREFLNCFEEIRKSFSDCSFFLIIFLVLWMTVSFLLLLSSHKENIGSSNKIMKPEEFLEENIIMCYVRAFSFCFLHKRFRLS